MIILAKERITFNQKNLENKEINEQLTTFSYLRIHWRLSKILKTSSKSAWSDVFWYSTRACIFWKCIQYTLHRDKTEMLKKFPSDKINGTKNASFFFRKLQLITVLLLMYDSYRDWSTRFVSLKLCMWDFPFWIPFRFIFIKV